MFALADFPDEDIRVFPRHARVAPLATTSTPPDIASPIFVIFLKRNRRLASLTNAVTDRCARIHDERRGSIELFPRSSRALLARRRLPTPSSGATFAVRRLFVSRANLESSLSA